MNWQLPKAVTVRLAEGRPVIADITAASLPARLRGKPELDSSLYPDGCSMCVDACPAGAISRNPLTIDLGTCLFCPLCAEACPEGAITYTNEYKMAATSREGLLLREGRDIAPEACSREIRCLFGRSLKLRSVSAGGCSGCELELNALGNVNFDMGRFGIEFVASPRHADGISGTTTRAMAHALEATCDAIPKPNLIILFGACVISGGIFEGSGQLAREFIDRHKIDLYIPGCPPHPLTFIHGLLKYQHRGIEEMLPRKRPTQQVVLVESISGDSVIAHTTAFCSAIEAFVGFSPSLREQSVRGIAAEPERIAMHLSTLGGIATDIGFVLPAAAFGALRTAVINLTAEICGSRFGRGWIVLDGVRFDLDPPLIDKARHVLGEVLEKFPNIEALLFNSPSAPARMEETGIVTMKQPRDIPPLASPPAPPTSLAMCGQISPTASTDTPRFHRPRLTPAMSMRGQNCALWRFSTPPTSSSSCLTKSPCPFHR